MILIIEDNNDIRENLSELLMLEGFLVTTADCGIKALEMAQQHTPALLICDILMPGMDGYEVFVAFKQNKHIASVPFIFSSSKAEKGDHQKAKALGAAYYLVKPFDDAVLLNCIKNCLQQLQHIPLFGCKTNYQEC